MQPKNLSYREHARMLWIHNQIQKNCYPNTKKIAEQFEISTKTAQRLIDVMRDQRNLPMEYSAKYRGWYYTEHVHSLHQVTLTEGDLVALLLAEKLAQQYQGTAIEKQLNLAFSKVLQALTDDISIDLEALSDAYSFEASVCAELNFETLKTLEQAISTKSVIQILYFTASSGSTKSRKVKPFRLRNFQGEWYLIGFDYLREEIRVFHANRIRDLKLLEEKFTLPNDFDINKYLQDGFSMIRGAQKFEIELIFDEYQSRWIRERASLHPTEQRSDLPDGSLKITMTVTALDGIKRFVMQYGSHVQVIKPLELRQEILAEINKMQDFYK